MSSKFIYRDKDWLYQQYIIENKNATEIGQEFDLSVAGIRNYIKKFQFQKSYEDKMKARDRQIKKTMIGKYGEDSALKVSKFRKKKDQSCLEKYGTKEPMRSESIKSKYIDSIRKAYGVDNPLQSKDIRQKYEKTCQEKFGCSVPTKNSLVVNKIKNTVENKYGEVWISKVESIKNKKRNTLIKNGNIHLVNGQSALGFSRTNNVNYTALLNWIRNGGDAVSFAENYQKKISSLELLFSEKAGLDFYNKSFDIEKYPDLKYRPDFKINDCYAINVDGLYWHSEINQYDKKYHFNMRKDYEKHSLRLFQFYSDEVFNKFEIISSIISNANNGSKKIFARKTSIGSISQKESDSFYNRTHIMGSRKAKHIALFYNKKIVMCMSYTIKNDIIKIERMSSELYTVVVGGFGKLFSYLINNYNFHKVHYWVDLRYGTGNFLEQFGFEIEKETLGWKWTDFRNTYNRLRCRANMDDRGLTEAEHAAELGWVKIYDAGQRLWFLNRQ